MIYIWFLLTLPHDRLLCELWTRQLPSPAALVQACGTDQLAKYRLDVTRDGVGVCSIPAASLNWVMSDCNLNGTLDQYRLRIIEPHYQDLIGCSVTTLTADAPNADEIKRQCPDAKDYELQFSGTRQADPEAGSCKPPTISQPASIATSHDLYLLAGKMIWYGYAKSTCPNGLSGVSLPTYAATTCGMDGARTEMIAWQNSLDTQILQAASEWNVPAELLKRTIERETQFWSWTGIHDEHGLIQITDAGAYVVLHVYEDAYYQLTRLEQAEARSAWLNSLDCLYCTPKQALTKAQSDMSKYAQALAAYYCMYGSWDEAMTAWNINNKEN